ncbi:ribosome-binding factor A [Aquimarina brevivitae]|uniref:Ribosome-binding factor A n=2 Tax=Aquimarina brevivitae TaxID=323412 RepID=A0A4Q7PH08_9FLAO|nr:ribosome-binding factor A [Aquimarina brevivitae]
MPIFVPMETNRQKKIAGVLQKDVADVIQLALREAGVTGILVSVTKVNVTSDLSIAKVYLSVFPHDQGKRILEEVNAVKSRIKHLVAQKTKNQLRRMPEVSYYIDDSLEYIDNIDKALKGKENPVDNPDLLERRKKK